MSIGLVNGLQNSDSSGVINTSWIDFSEQSTIVGWSTFTTKLIRYKIVGNIVYVFFNIQGTSNSTSTNFTLPISTRLISGVSSIGIPYCYGVDNGVAQVSLISQTTLPSNTFNIQRYTTINAISLSWTASGTKQITGQFFYEI